MKEIIGKRFESMNCGWFIVRKEVKRNGRCYYEIEFDEINGIKYKTFAQRKIILKGNIKNPYYPSVAGIGYLGNAKFTTNKKLYRRWQNIICRCYYPRYKQYEMYGAKGVTVCNRWHCYEYFLEDFIQLHGYDENNLHNLHLDKDSKILGNKVYSPDACVLITAQQNLAVMHQNLKYDYKKFKAFSPNGTIHYGTNQRIFAEEHGLSRTGIISVLKGRTGTHKGWKFKYV